MFNWLTFYRLAVNQLGVKDGNELFDIHFNFWLSCGDLSLQKYDCYRHVINLR